MPAATNPAQFTNCQGVAGNCPTVNGAAAAPLTGGYGFVNTINGAGTNPRTGQFVGRISF